jgi:CBS domain-containing protein
MEGKPMNIGNICIREVVTAKRGDALSQVARAMCERHVGMVVVVDEHDGHRFPIGVLTDRDVVRAQLGRASDMYCLNVAEAMSGDVLTLSESDSLMDAIGRLRTRGVRRAPVVSTTGVLVGVVSVDDLLMVVSAELAGLSRLVATQPERETRIRAPT